MQQTLKKTLLKKMAPSLARDATFIATNTRQMSNGI